MSGLLKYEVFLLDKHIPQNPLNLMAAEFGSPVGAKLFIREPFSGCLGYRMTILKKGYDVHVLEPCTECKGEENGHG